MILIFPQPIQALEHTKFRELIDIASRATNGVKIPHRKLTRGDIKRLFKEHLTKLKTQLNVSISEMLDAYYPFLIALQGPTVQGEVSLTCDAWQASNTDGYSAVTAHWIEEPTSAKWELKNALIGFTRLNNAHNGERLGQALFKVIERIGIGHKVSLLVRSMFHFCLSVVKVGHITCDNASNNTTMMKELAARLNTRTGKTYHWKKRKVKFVSSFTHSLHLLIKK